MNIIPTYVKIKFFQYIPSQMLDSGTPDIQIQTPKSFKNMTCKHACQKTQLLFQSWPKTFDWRPEIPPKSTEIQACNPKVSFLVLPSPPASLDGPQGAKVHATSIPNDTFRATNLAPWGPSSDAGGLGSTRKETLGFQAWISIDLGRISGPPFGSFFPVSAWRRVLL